MPETVSAFLKVLIKVMIISNIKRFMISLIVRKLNFYL